MAIIENGDLTYIKIHLYIDINIFDIFDFFFFVELKEKICSSSPQLTAEQLKQIEQKRHEAMKRLAARSDPMLIGESWCNHIGNEFAKPYFTKVFDITHSTDTSRSKP